MRFSSETVSPLIFKAEKMPGIATLWYNPHNEKADGNIIPDYEVTSLDMIPIVAEMFFSRELSSNDK